MMGKTETVGLTLDPLISSFPHTKSCLQLKMAGDDKNGKKHLIYQSLIIEAINNANDEGI